MIIVFDSGVWISAMHFGGTPLVALNHGFLHHELAICDQIVEEIRAVLMTKFQWKEDEVSDVLDEYLSGTPNTPISGTVRGVCRDPKDDMVLECAANAKAQLVVSGDKDLLAVVLFKQIRIVTPRIYLMEIGSQEGF